MSIIYSTNKTTMDQGIALHTKKIIKIYLQGNYPIPLNPQLAGAVSKKANL
jgi:hypothetical protein